MNRIDRVLGSIPVYYKNDRTCLLHGDTFSLLKRLPKESIDLIFADPPYFVIMELLVKRDEWYL